MIRNNAHNIIDSSPGKPAEFTTDDETQIRKYLQKCTLRFDFSTKRELEKMYECSLNAQLNQCSFSNSFEEFLKRIATDDEVWLVKLVDAG